MILSLWFKLCIFGVELIDKYFTINVLKNPWERMKQLALITCGPCLEEWDAVTWCFSPLSASGLIDVSFILMIEGILSITIHKILLDKFDSKTTLSTYFSFFIRNVGRFLYEGHLECLFMTIKFDLRKVVMFG